MLTKVMEVSERNRLAGADDPREEHGDAVGATHRGMLLPNNSVYS